MIQNTKKTKTNEKRMNEGQLQAVVSNQLSRKKERKK